MDRMNKKISIGATAALIIIAVALTISVTMVVAMRRFSSLVNDPTKRGAVADYVAEVDRYLRQHYVGEIDENKLLDALGKGYASGTGDPYAAFLSPTEYQRELAVRTGETTGFGLEVAKSTAGEMVVYLLHKNSAAERAGVQVGDIVTAVDDTAVTPDSYSTAKGKLASQQKVMLTLSRGGKSTAVELSTSPYTLISVQGRMIGETGYIRIRAFHDNTPQQFKEVYASLEKEGATRFIFDVRNNTGGTLTAATDIIAYLMPVGPYAKQTDQAGTVTELAAADTYQIGKPAVTLVNAGTAGEAELFAGVLHEGGFAPIVGTQTAGRSLVQELYPISADNAAIKISAYRLSLLKGGEWEGKGLTPSTVAALGAEEEAVFELLTDDQDSQLQAAMIALKGGNAMTTTVAGSTGTTTGSSTGTGTTAAPASSK